jgi:hypothetical protein
MTEKKETHAPLDRESMRPVNSIALITVQIIISFLEEFFRKKIKAIEKGRNKFIYPPYIL